jgi:hypothetical protein
MENESDVRLSPNGVAQDLFGLGEKFVVIFNNFAESCQRICSAARG